MTRSSRLFPNLQLLPEHESFLADSGIAQHVADARGYESATIKARLEELGFGEKQRRVPALVLPVHGVASRDVALYQAHPDDPRRGPDGRAIKYETPRGARMALDCNPIMRERLKDQSVPLYVTEGIRKADSATSRGLCCVGLLGVWNFRGRNEVGGLTALSDWESIALKDRKAYICFDSDVMEKAAVHQALARLKLFLEGRGASVRLIYLPPGEGGVKVGLDDFLVAGRTVEDLLALATSELRRHDDGDDARYRVTPAGLVWIRRTADGELGAALTNFDARIVAERVLDDGVETRRVYEIEAHVGGRARRVSVPAEDFPRMNWVASNLSAQAILPAGATMRDRVREAIQCVSGPIEERHVFAHTGWREIGGQWVYLHGGGAIGPGGCLAGLEVRLPGSLARFVLPAPAEGERPRDAIRASLALLEIGPDVVIVPLLAAAYRATLGAADFSVHITGETGAMKTTLAALVQQHVGAGMDVANLPGHWSSTANALEEVAFGAKDAVLVVDDFAPSGSAQDVRRQHRDAERLFRAQGNQAGRQRMRADITLRPERPPRGLIISTGEEVLRGHSVRARMLIVELAKGTVDREHLTTCQRAAAEGVYAQAMAAYIMWLATRYTQVCGTLSDQVRDLYEAVQARLRYTHPRTPWIVAHLLAGLCAALVFALDVSAVSGEEAEHLWRRGEEALLAVGAAQGAQQAEADPVRRFGRLLLAVLQSGQAYVAGADGTTPPAGEAGDWGWRVSGGGELRPQGLRLGWSEGDALYVNPDAAYAAVQRLAEDQGERLGSDRDTLGKRLRERGVLTDFDPGHTTARRAFDGHRARVWCLDFPKLLEVSPVHEAVQAVQAPATHGNQSVAPGPLALPLRQTRWYRAVLGPVDPGGQEEAPGRRPADPTAQAIQSKDVANQGVQTAAPLGPPASTKRGPEFLENPSLERCWTCGRRDWSVTPDGHCVCNVCHPSIGSGRPGRDGATP